MLAKELKIGDFIVTAAHRCVALTELLDTGEWDVLHNLRVQDYHTNFVGDESWSFEVWSHNQ